MIFAVALLPILYLCAGCAAGAVVGQASSANDEAREAREGNKAVQSEREREMTAERAG